MFGNHDDSNERYAYEQIQNAQPHEAKFSHEALSGAAAFAAMRMYENKQKAEGKNVSWALGKEAIAAFAAAEVDKLIETKGMDAIDREKAKHEAAEKAKHALSQSNMHEGPQEYYQQQPYNGRGYEGPQGYPPQGQQGWGAPHQYEAPPQGYYREGPPQDWNNHYGPPQGFGGYGGGGGYEGERRHHEGREERREEREERREERREEHERRW